MTLHLLTIAVNKSQRRARKAKSSVKSRPDSLTRRNSKVIRLCIFAMRARRFTGSKHAHERPPCRLLQGSVSLSLFSFLSFPFTEETIAIFLQFLSDGMTHCDN